MLSNVLLAMEPAGQKGTDENESENENASWQGNNEDEEVASELVSVC